MPELQEMFLGCFESRVFKRELRPEVFSTDYKMHALNRATLAMAAAQPAQSRCEQSKRAESRLRSFLDGRRIS